MTCRDKVFKDFSQISQCIYKVAEDLTHKYGLEREVELKVFLIDKGFP